MICCCVILAILGAASAIIFLTLSSPLAAKLKFCTMFTAPVSPLASTPHLPPLPLLRGIIASGPASPIRPVLPPAIGKYVGPPTTPPLA